MQKKPRRSALLAYDPSIDEKNLNVLDAEDYAADCSFTYDNLASRADIFLLAHFLGWVAKFCLFRSLTGVCVCVPVCVGVRVGVGVLGGHCVRCMSGLTSSMNGLLAVALKSCPPYSKILPTCLHLNVGKGIISFCHARLP